MRRGDDDEQPEPDESAEARPRQIERVVVMLVPMLMWVSWVSGLVGAMQDDVEHRARDERLEYGDAAPRYTFEDSAADEVADGRRDREQAEDERRRTRSANRLHDRPDREAVGQPMQHDGERENAPVLVAVGCDERSAIDERMHHEPEGDDGNEDGVRAAAVLGALEHHGERKSGQRDGDREGADHLHRVRDDVQEDEPPDRDENEPVEELHGGPHAVHRVREHWTEAERHEAQRQQQHRRASLM